MVRDRVRVYIVSSFPPLEVVSPTLESGTRLGAYNVGVSIGSVLAGCGLSLASRSTLGDGASVGSGLGTYLGACGDGERDRHFSKIWHTLSMASSCPWLVIAGSSLRAQGIILIAWVTLSSCVRVGCVV